MKRLGIISTLAGMLIIVAGCSQRKIHDGVIFSCEEYVLTSDSLIEAGKVVVRAPSSMHLVSTYTSPPSTPGSNQIRFRFLFNGDFAEFSDSSMSHPLRIDGSPLLDSLVFTPGSIPAEENMRFAATDSGSLSSNTPFTFRADMRPILKQMGRHGHYIRRGDTLRRQDFRGVWIIGDNPAIDATPENPARFARQQLHDRSDSIFELTVELNPVPRFPEQQHDWMIRDYSAFYPRASIGMHLPDALYNMAVSTLSADTVTPYTPLSVLLSLGMLDPERSMQSLREMVKNGRIVSQEGSDWPIDISRIAWIIAAWEVYCVTGDESWADEIFETARLSLADDRYVNYAPPLGLYRGGIVPIPDARDFYPPWMAPVDIYNSYSSTANALYCHTFSIMEALASTRSENPERYGEISRNLADAINLYLWTPDKGYYSQMLYGLYPVQAPVTDNIAQALCILYDIATPEMGKRIIEKCRPGYYGFTTLWPATSESPGPYSGTVTPTVNALWALAAAKAHDAPLMSLAMASLMRGAALWGNEAPAVDAKSGDIIAIDMTSSEILESAASRLAPTLRALFGLRFTPQGIEFAPVIPAQYKEEKLITGLRYRSSNLSVIIHGTGSRIARFTIDGKAMPKPFLPGDISGHHTVEITMAGNSLEHYQINYGSTDLCIPETPLVMDTHGEMVFPRYTGKDIYVPYINGVAGPEFSEGSTAIANPGCFSSISYATLGSDGTESYISPTWMNLPREAVTIVPADTVTGKAVLTSTVNSHFPVETEIAEEGSYLIDVCYSNGAGPVNYQSGCGIRTLLVNGDRAGALVMPQLGTGRWDRRAYSNMLEINLSQGMNTLAIDYVVPYNINSMASENMVEIYHLRLIRLDRK